MNRREETLSTFLTAMVEFLQIIKH